MRDPPPGEPISGRLSAVPAADTVALLRKIEAAVATDHDDALEVIYREVDALLRRVSFVQVDDLLRTIEVGALPVVHLLAFTSITYAARDHLRSRGAFVTRVRRRLHEG